MTFNKSIITTIVTVTTIISLSACSTMENNHYAKPLIEPIIGNGNHVGYAPHDPCIRCGEGWIFIPNSAQDSKNARQKWLEEMEARGFDTKGDIQ